MAFNNQNDSSNSDEGHCLRSRFQEADLGFLFGCVKFQKTSELPNAEGSIWWREGRTDSSGSMKFSGEAGAGDKNLDQKSVAWHVSVEYYNSKSIPYKSVTFILCPFELTFLL